MKSLTPFIILLLAITKGFGQQSDSASVEKKIAPWFVERFKLTAGFFLPVNNTSIQVGLTGKAAGTEIDFQKDLGYTQEVGTFLAGFQWRISRRSRINFSYYDINRSANHTLDKTIYFKGDTFNINTSIHTFFNTAIYQVSYGYAILSKPNYEAGVLIGTHLIGGKVGISANGTNMGISKTSDFGFTAPLPDLGLWGGYAFTPRLAANADIDYLSLTVGDISGSIFAYNILLTYKLIKQLDISLGYTGLNFKVDATKENVNGHFKWGYNGPSLSATFVFGKKSWSHPSGTD